MLVNVKIMHIGSKNPNIEYYIENGNWCVTEAYKDLGIIITYNCKNKLQVEQSNQQSL